MKPSFSFQKPNVMQIVLIILVAGLMLAVWPLALIRPSAHHNDDLYGEDTFSFVTLTDGDEASAQIEGDGRILTMVTFRLRLDEVRFAETGGEVVASISSADGTTLASDTLEIMRDMPKAFCHLRCNLRLNEGETYTFTVEAKDNSLPVEVMCEAGTSDMALVTDYRAHFSLKTVGLIWLLGLLLIVLILHVPGSRVRNDWLMAMMAILTFGIAFFGYYIVHIRQVSAELPWLTGVFVFAGVLSFIHLLFLMWEAFFSRKLSPERTFLISAVLMGLCFSVTLPVFTAPDEPTHFVTSYVYASRLLGKAVIYENEEGIPVIAMRTEDGIYVKERPDPYLYETFYGFDFTGVEGATDVVPEYAATMSSVSFIAYLPQILGMTLGMLFDASFRTLCILGRMCNLAAFILLTFFAIRALPFGKWNLYLVTQIPIVLELTGSLSYDVFNMGLLFLFLSLCIREIAAPAPESADSSPVEAPAKEPAGMRKLLPLSILGIVTVSLKGAYFPVLLLLIPVFYRRMPGDARKKRIITACMAVAVIALACALPLVIFSRLPGAAGFSFMSYTTVDPATYTQHYTLNTLILLFRDNFTAFFSMVCKTVIHPDRVIASAFGSLLSWVLPITPSLVVFAFGLMYFLTLLTGEEGKERISGNLRALSVLIFCGIVVIFYCIMLYAFTDTNFDYIEGVQGRYFIPVFPVLLLATARISVLPSKRSLRALLMLTAGVCNAITLFAVVAYAAQA